MTMRGRGSKARARKLRQVNVAMTEELVAALDRYATDEFMTRPEAVRSLLADALAFSPDKGGAGT